jgi:hypothetical protein
LSAVTQQKAKVNVVRKILTQDNINKMYAIYGLKFKLDKRKTNDILEGKDWNMVLRFLIFNNMPHIVTKKTLGMQSDNNSSYSDLTSMHTDIWSDNSFNIGQDLNEVYEVHTDKTIQVFINGVDQGVYARI